MVRLAANFVFCSTSSIVGTQRCLGHFASGGGNCLSPRLVVSSQKPLTGLLDTTQSLRFPVTHTFWPCSDNSDTFFFSSIFLLGYISFFSVWEPEATLCVSQMKHLTSLLGVFYFGHCCRKLSVKCAPGAAVCSSIGLLWGTGHADCPYGAPTHLCSENINTWWVMICLFLLIYHILDLKSSNKKNCCTWHLCKMLSTIHIFQRKPVVATVIMMDATEEGR